MKQRRKPCSGSPSVEQDLNTRHDWHVKKAIVDLPVKVKGNSKRTSSNSSSPLVAKNKNIGVASQTLITEVKFLM